MKRFFKSLILIRLGFLKVGFSGKRWGVKKNLSYINIALYNLLNNLFKYFESGKILTSSVIRWRH